jgi:hypothetical protein
MKKPIDRGSAAYLRQEKACNRRPPAEVIDEYRNLLCEAYHGPKPEGGLAIVYDLSKPPTADNISWGVHIQSRFLRKPRKKR